MERRYVYFPCILGVSLYQWRCCHDYTSATADNVAWLLPELQDFHALMLGICTSRRPSFLYLIRTAPHLVNGGLVRGTCKQRAGMLDFSTEKLGVLICPTVIRTFKSELDVYTNVLASDHRRPLSEHLVRARRPHKCIGERPSQNGCACG